MVRNIFQLCLCVSILPAVAAADAGVAGVVYFDANGNSVSIEHQHEGWVDRGIGDVEIQLLGTNPTTRTWTLTSGEFMFESVPDGTYLLALPSAVGDLYCSSHNHPVWLPRAVAAEQVTLVAFGDSLAVVGSDETFPARVADDLAPLADVTLRNVAIGGSTAAQWVPGTPYFEDILTPALEDADLVMFSLGGNDFGAYFHPPPYDSGEFLELLAGFPDAYREIKDDLLTIAGEIHARFPQVDIAYIVYPNFLDTTVWQSYLGDLWPTAKKVVYGVFSDMRAAMARLDYVILVDMLDALENQRLDDLLIDAVHCNDAGHQAYADEIFYTVGGVVVGNSPLGLERRYGFAPDRAQGPSSLPPNRLHRTAR